MVPRTAVNRGKAPCIPRPPRSNQQDEQFAGLLQPPTVSKEKPGAPPHPGALARVTAARFIRGMASVTMATPQGSAAVRATRHAEAEKIRPRIRIIVSPAASRKRSWRRS
jgi:hypothetical protein